MKELKAFLKTLWQMTFIKFIVIAYVVFTIETMLIDALLPAYFASDIFKAIIAGELAAFCIYLFKKHQKDRASKRALIIAISVLLIYTIFHAVISLTHVITWLALS